VNGRHGFGTQELPLVTRSDKPLQGGERWFSTLASTREDFHKVLQPDCLGKSERRKKTEAADAPGTIYPPTARRYPFTTLSLLGGEGRNRPVPTGFSRQIYPIRWATQALPVLTRTYSVATVC